jgi:hypothetical protein
MSIAEFNKKSKRMEEKNAIKKIVKICFLGVICFFANPSAETHQ